MFRNAALIFLISLTFPVIGAWEFLTTHVQPPTILPRDCTLPVDGEVYLSLQGFLPSNAVAVWDVDQGGISSVLPGSEAVLVAPSKPTTVTVSVSISPALPGMDRPIKRECAVTAE